MSPDNYLVPVYAVYTVISVALVVWLARTLFRNGAVFLEDVFADQPGLAAAVNHLLVVGFYLLNLGYAFLILRANAAPDAISAVEVLVQKLGALFLSLGVLHLLNMYVFYRIRRRAEAPTLPVPVAPQLSVPAPPPAPGAAW